MMHRYHVSVAYRTESGTLATAGLTKIAASEAQAERFAIATVTKDRRRRCKFVTKARAEMLPEC